MEKLVGILVILFCAIAPTAQEVQDAGKNTPSEPTSQYVNKDTNDPRADLAKMRTLLGQMQRNVAFVSAGDTPLKHQFELEIEMWQLLLRDMERKLNAQQNVPAQ
jgi:hypothetical protein